MSEQDKQTEQVEGQAVDPAKRPADDPAAYPAWFMACLTRPDETLDQKTRSSRLFGLINMGLLVALIALSSMVQRMALRSTGGFRSAWLIDGIKFGLSFAIPLALVLFALKWYSDREGRGLDLDFFIEKLGAALALSIVLVAIAIPLNLFNITMHSWFRAAGLNFIYIAVFAMSFMHAAPRQIKVAAVFALAFYFCYRLVWLLM